MTSSYGEIGTMRVSHILFVLAALLMPYAAAGQKVLPNINAIDRAVHAQVDSGFSGVVLVAWQDSLLLERAYASQPNKLHANDAFWIGSMTKGFTAAAVLRLQNEGRLRLTDSIGRFFPDAPRDKQSITIQQLLTHTSGLGGVYSGGGIADRSRAVRTILARDLSFSPGHGYRYGDDDYELLAAIIEIAAGVPWEDYVRTRLLTPLHLANTGFACPTSRVACDWGHKGANGMFATAEDLLKWSRALLVGGTLGAAGQGAITRPQVFVRREPPFDVSYGYGVRVYTLSGKIVEVMHSGSGDNDHTGVIRNFSSGLTVIVLSKAGQHEGTTWASFVARQVMTR